MSAARPCAPFCPSRCRRSRRSSSPALAHACTTVRSSRAGVWTRSRPCCPIPISSCTPTSGAKRCSPARSRARSPRFPTCSCSSSTRLPARRFDDVGRGLQLRRSPRARPGSPARGLPALQPAAARDAREAARRAAAARTGSPASSARARTGSAGTRPGNAAVRPAAAAGGARPAWLRWSASSTTTRCRARPSSGGAGPRAVRDHPPVPRRQRTRGAAAHRAPAPPRAGCFASRCST